MGINILKSTGKIILSVFLVLAGIGLYAAEIETELTPSKIAAGESASLSFRITGKSSKITPVKFPAVPGLQITYAGSSHSYEYVNGRSWSGTVLTFSIYGEKKGEYKIPPFILDADGEKISSREVTLTVRESSSRGSGGSGGGGGQFRSEVDLSSETVYTGEPFIMNYYIYGGEDNSPDIEGFSEQPHVRGFVMKALSEKSDVSGKTNAGSFCLVPVDSGVHEIGGGSVVVSVDMNEGFFSMSGRKKILFPYKKVNVIPIPSAGRSENFKGDVGEFKIDAQIPSGKFNLFEEIKIPVKISGKGNLLTLSKPLIENEDGIKTVIEEKEQKLFLDGGSISGEKNFLVTVIPQKEGPLNCGSIYIEYFNPYKKSYEKAESGPLAFEIQKDHNSDDKSEVQFTDSTGRGFSLNYIYAIIILSLLAAAVVSLVLWEKKKLKIIKDELKPDIPEEDEISTVNIREDILKNIQTSVKDKNSAEFLYNADRGINLIESSRLSDSERSRFDSFKEKIYYCRYGGGTFAEQEMDALIVWLKKNLK